LTHIAIKLGSITKSDYGSQLNNFIERDVFAEGY